jgi:hypothetical protein
MGARSAGFYQWITHGLVIHVTVMVTGVVTALGLQACGPGHANTICDRVLERKGVARASPRASAGHMKPYDHIKGRAQG